MQELNLQYAPVSVRPVVHVSQYDEGRQFKLAIYDGVSPVSPPSGTTIRVDGIKPDRKGFSYTNAATVSGNVLTITTTKQMTCVHGLVKCEVRFVKGGTDIGTLNFDMLVEASPINEGTDISETVLPAIIELANKQMLAAEAWAVGTKNGTPVESTDEQYHNNAKYYSDEASHVTDDSEAWAVGSRKGIPVPSTDPTYHNNSKYYAELGIDSANKAESYAVGGTGTRTGEDTDNSQYYSQQSGISATNANNSAGAALLSEQNAKLSENILQYYVSFVIPRFKIVNNRIYLSDPAVGEFATGNNRLYIKNGTP